LVRLSKVVDWKKLDETFGESHDYSINFGANNNN
jgi:hypothetical protein